MYNSVSHNIYKKKKGETTLLVPKVCLLRAFGLSSFKYALLVPEVLNMNAISPSVNFR